jgi:MFS family permease
MVAVLMVMSALAFLDRHILTLMVAPIRTDLRISDFQVGLLQGIGFAIFGATFGLPLGWLADRYPRRLIVFGGVLVWSLATSAGGLAQSFGALFLARILVGAGEAALGPAAASLISDAFPRRRVTTALATYSAGSAIGAAFALGFGGLLVGHALHRPEIVAPVLGKLRPWQFVYLVIGAPGLALAFLSLVIREPVRRGASRAGRRPLSPFLRRHGRMFAGHFGGFAAMNLMAFSVVAWTPTYMMRRFHMDVAAVGMSLSVLAICAVACGIVMGWCVDHWFARGRTDAHLRFYAIVAPTAAALLGMSFLMPNPVSFLIFHILANGLMAYSGVAFAAIQLVTPNELRGQVSAVYGLVVSLVGLGLGPMATGFVTDYVFHDDKMVGWAMFTVAASVAPAAAALLWFGAGGMRDAYEVAAAGPCR